MITHVKDNALLEAAGKVSSEYISKCNPNKPEEGPIATKRESYGIETLLSSSSIVNCIDQLYFSIKMLSGYRSNITKKDMNRYDYIVFGVENYYLRLTSVFDRCLILANVIYQLGLPDRQCRNDTIIKNSHIMRTSVATRLKELDKFTQPFRFHRNTIAHTTSYTDKELNQLGSYYYIVEHDNSLKIYDHQYKTLADKYIADKKIDFDENILKLVNLVDEYFFSLLNIFEKKLKSYTQ